MFGTREYWDEDKKAAVMKTKAELKEFRKFHEDMLARTFHFPSVESYLIDLFLVEDEVNAKADEVELQGKDGKKGMLIC